MSQEGIDGGVKGEGRLGGHIFGALAGWSLLSPDWSIIMIWKIFSPYISHYFSFRFLFIGLGYAALPTILIALLAPQIIDIFQQQYAVDW